MQLTQDQIKLKNTIRNFYSSSQPYLTIDGAAGTGKTTVIKELLKDEEKINNTLSFIDPSYIPKTLKLTATTNKAVNILQQQLINQNTYINDHKVTTVHSALNITIYKGVLVKKTDISTLASELKSNIILIDECSMIADNLYKIIQELSTYGIKFIFMGDSSQLPPVKSSTISQVFKHTTVTLTEVVRQKDELLELATNFRSFVETNKYPIVKPNKKNIIHVDQETFNKTILDDMSDSNWTIKDSRILAYSNKKVLEYNNMVKEKITGTSIILPGEYAINNHFIKGSPKVNIPTEAEVFINYKTPMTLLNLIVDSYDISYGLKNTTVWMPRNYEDSKQLNKYFKTGKLPSLLLDFQADLRAMYASTIHKAQGSTFKRVYIDLNSIKSVQHYDFELFKRLLYVAVSRASEQIIFTGDI